ncbi:hypothetical protein B7494_g8512 [Chlorociboria aeruginascens]|nr:hypothetical protein B7494_g8512 [Chlorociboria aeruginascens]
MSAPGGGGIVFYKHLVSIIALATAHKGHLPKVPGHMAPPKDIQDSSTISPNPTHTVPEDHVYRVRGLPWGISYQQIGVLATTLFNLENDAPRIRSLAKDHDGRTMVATLSFRRIPAELSGDGEQWSFDITNFLRNLPAEHEDTELARRSCTLTIDDHFRGLTILSSPPPSDHEVERSPDNPSYDLRLRSELYGSQSFQDFEALATTLRETLKGVMLNAEAIIQMYNAAIHNRGILKNSQARSQMYHAATDDLDMRDSIYGALFFGVPNQGMDIKSLIPMVENQVNASLLHHLSTESQLLREQSRNFPKAFHFSDSKVVCFYETVTSPTAIRKADQWSMEGSHVILVGSASATHGRPWENQAHHVQAINRDHSQLVKFKANDEVYYRILGTLKEFVKKAFEMKRGLTADDYEARTDTCGWILTHDAYQRWIDNQHGLLWVKGKPGSGKSTLMKRIYKENTTQADCAPARVVFRAHYQEKLAYGRHGKDWDWHDMKLRQVLKSALVVAAKSHTISIFIDALDEAGESEAEPIVTYVCEVHEELQSSAGQTRICFSCRHYPILSRNIGFEVCMENQNEEDISGCVRRELSEKIQKHQRLSWADDLKELQDEIASRADGVFLWATLTVPLVAKEYNKGKGLKDVQKKLRKAPRDLVSIYEHILTTLIDVEDREESMHLMQWISLAKRPLSVTELRYALALDDSVIHEVYDSVQGSDVFVKDDSQMKQLITSLSGGLVEVQQHRDSTVVQFIHQSVNDSLLEGAFEWLGMKNPQDIVGQGHHRLTRSCVNYLTLREVQEVELFSSHSGRETQLPPFLDYATEFWFLHAQEAESRDIAQTDLIQRFEWPNSQYFDRWIDIFRAIDKHDTRCPEVLTTLLHTSAASNLRSIVQELLVSGSLLEEDDVCGNRALHFAARFGHERIVKILLDAGADLQAQNINGDTALERAALGGGNHGNALQAAIYQGYKPIIKLLLDKKADINAQVGQYGNALQAAAAVLYEEHEFVIKLLLDKGADINAQGGEYGNALQAAAYQGYEYIIELFLDKGADINAQGGKYGNAFQAAAYKGHEPVVKLLLDKSANIINQDNQGRYPFHFAIRGGHYKLLDLVSSNIKIPDWNYQDLQGCSALHFAASSGSNQIVQVILESNVDINLLDTYGWTALHWACRNGSRKLIHMLRESGADSNRKDINGWTPLDVATFSHNGFLASLFQDNIGQAGSKQLITSPGKRQYSYSCDSCYHREYLRFPLPTDGGPGTDQDQRHKLKRPVSAAEIRAALRKANTGRSPGLDGLPIELYKGITTCCEEGPKVVHEWLVELFNSVRNLKEIPIWFSEGCLTLLYKKGEKNDIRNYRPLTVLNTDYKLYSWILFQRFLEWSNHLIGEHQTAFLRGRLIGDNVKLVQCAVDKFKKDDEGIGLLFLDQEKAYDRVSHTWMWACLRKFKFPKEVISEIKMLYHRARVTPWINGFKGLYVYLLSGVRQGDPLSCILFILTIEPFIQLLIHNAELRGLQTRLGTTKVVLYADDTTIVVRSMREIQVVVDVLEVYSLASGAKVNWPKSKLMLLGGFSTLQTDDLPVPVDVLRKGDAYTHLGIPVGDDIQPAINAYWGGMITKMAQKVEFWIKLRVSQQARARIATTLLLSLPRYGMNLLGASKRTLDKITALQQTLIWGGRYAHMRASKTFLPRECGGLKLQDPLLIATVQAITWICRMETKPELPWVQLATTLCQGTRSVGLHAEKADTPWKQKLNSVHQSTIHLPSIDYFWKAWWKLLRTPGSARCIGPAFVGPETATQVLNTRFWYYPDIFQDGPLQNRGVGTWTSATWKRIAEGYYGPIERIGDLWDPKNQRPKTPDAPPESHAFFRRAVNTFMKGIPRPWMAALEAMDPAEAEAWWRSPEPFSYCGMWLPHRDEFEFYELSDLTYKYVYKTMAADKATDNTNLLDHRTDAVQETMSRTLKRTITAANLWNSIRKKGRVPKQNDLLYRLLLGVVKTGDLLHWKDKDAQTCPYDGTLQSIEHVWLECDVAQAIWARFRRTFQAAARSQTDVPVPSTKGELIGFMALEPIELDRIGQLRWRLMYAEAIWQIWKLYLNNSYRKEPLTPEGAPSRHTAVPETLGGDPRPNRPAGEPTVPAVTVDLALNNEVDSLDDSPGSPSLRDVLPRDAPGAPEEGRHTAPRPNDYRVSSYRPSKGLIRRDAWLPAEASQAYVLEFRYARTAQPTTLHNREEPLIQIIGFCGCLTRQCRDATICWIMAERL